MSVAFELLSRPEYVAPALEECGLRAEGAHDKAELFRSCAAFLRHRGHLKGCAFFVPGRVEVVGKHTDYAGGSSIVAAVNRGFCIAGSLSPDPVINIRDAGCGESFSIPIAAIPPAAAGHWSNYPITTVRRLAANFPGRLQGADICFASDLPPAAGLSSSSAFMVAVYMVLSQLCRCAEDSEFSKNISGRLDLASYLGTIENGQSFRSLHGEKGVGTFGGSEDHCAILCGAAGRLVKFSYCPADLREMLSLPSGYTFVIAQSGIHAHKTGAAKELYNMASRKVSELSRIWELASGTPMTLARVCKSPERLERLRDQIDESESELFSPGELHERLSHFIGENQEVVERVTAAFRSGDIAELSGFIDRSQQLSEQLLKNQIPETVAMTRIARALGAPCASAFGAGFGGSVWALVPHSDAQGFGLRWLSEYRSQFPKHGDSCSYFCSDPAPATFEVTVN